MDEKILACEFKLRFYNRVAWNFNKETIKHVRFVYLLDDYFSDESGKYREYLHFVRDKGCDYYYYNSFVLSSIGL